MSPENYQLAQVNLVKFEADHGNLVYEFCRELPKEIVPLLAGNFLHEDKHLNQSLEEVFRLDFHQILQIIVKIHENLLAHHI